ncbi:MAG: chemotaxis protein CheB [Sphingobacteriales bacterium]|nr:MAG: chemotaxis protein CheB [Sphingobacteriales bacterium]
MAQEQIKNIKLIIIGGSSGSLEVIMKILPKLKKDFSIPVVIIMHRNTVSDSALTELLASRTFLTVKEAEDKDQLEPGSIYIAPPDYHLLIEADGTISLDASERVHYSRPSIDVSFMSAAVAYKNEGVAILLSGANADGAEGIKAIKDCGGYTIVQDPDEASVGYMPQQALLTKAVDEILSGERMGDWLNALS